MPPRRTPAARARKPPLRLPLSRLIQEFLDEVDQTLAPATLRAYEVPLTLYLHYLHDTLDRETFLDDLTGETVRGWVAQLRGQPKRLRGGLAVGTAPVSLATQRTYLRHLCAFANWLAKPPQHYTAESPLRYFKLPRGEQTVKVPVEPEDLQRLLQRAGREERDPVSSARGRALLLTLVDGGLRARELIELSIADVSLKEGILLVRRSKGKRPRLVAVGTETTRALRRYALLRDGQDTQPPTPQTPFFQTIHGRPFSYYGLRSWLRRLERDVDVPHVHLHLLRHTSAIETLDAGADIRTVQLKLGHADIHTTQGYLHMAAARVGQLQRAFSPVDHLALGHSGLLMSTSLAKPSSRIGASRRG